jgi:ribokinase
VRCAVVGHVEWVEFARVAELPTAGSIVHATQVWSEPAGGGAVVARQIARLVGRCEFFTALGDDALGHQAARQLSTLGIDVHAVHGGETRRAWTYVDQHGERTITVLGDKLLPRGPLPLAGYDAVFFVSGDVEALRSARAARLLAATLRERPTLSEGGVPLDLLVGSLNDAGERYDDSLDAKVVVLTDGGKGGTVNGERFAAAEPPGAISDAYGAGDSFAAALLVGLARGDDVAAAVRLGARAGAAVITGQGPYTAQLTS